MFIQIYRYCCGTISTEVGKTGTFSLKSHLQRRLLSYRGAIDPVFVAITPMSPRRDALLLGNKTLTPPTGGRSCRPHLSSCVRQSPVILRREADYVLLLLSVKSKRWEQPHRATKRTGTVRSLYLAGQIQIVEKVSLKIR